MNQLDPFDPGLFVAGDPLEAVAAFARALGARAVARDAADLSRHLDQARLFVVVLGGGVDVRAKVVNTILGGALLPEALDRLAIPLTIRHGSDRGARITFEHDVTREVDLSSLPRFLLSSQNPANERRVRLVEVRWDHSLTRYGACIVEGVTTDLQSGVTRVPRVDFVLVTDRDTTVPVLWRVEPASIRVFEPVDGENAVAAIAAIARATLDTGAARVEQLRSDEARRLCTRLEARLLEEQRALERAPDDSQARIEAIATCVTSFEAILARSRSTPDRVRDNLVTYVDAERRKLLMGSKADVLVSFGTRFARQTCSRRELRAVASEIAREIAGSALCNWYRGIRTHVDQQIGAMAEQLLRSAVAELGPLAVGVANLVLEGFSVMTNCEPFAIHADFDCPHGVWARCSELVIGERETRARVERAVGARLVEALEGESSRFAETLLRYYDRSRATIEARFANALDDFHQHVMVSHARGLELRASGQHVVAQEQRRLDACMRRLEQIRQALPIVAG